MTMIKLLILSDSHGTLTHMRRAVEAVNPTHVIHLGDHAADARDLQREYPMLPIAIVRGNCDFGEDTQEIRLAEYEGVRILMTHGHRHGVKSGLLRYSLAARENQVDVALFGHTHLAYCENEGGIWLLNPGTCGLSLRPTCGIIEIKNGRAACRIAAIDEME